MILSTQFQLGGVSTHASKRFLDTSRTSYSRTGCDRPLGDSVRPHGLRAQSHKSAPTFRSQTQVPFVPCASDRWFQVRGSHDPLLGSVNLLAGLTELRKRPTRHPAGLQARCAQQRPQGRRQRAGRGEGHPFLPPLPLPSLEAPQQVLWGLDSVTWA